MPILRSTCSCLLRIVYERMNMPLAFPSINSYFGVSITEYGTRYQQYYVSLSPSPLLPTNNKYLEVLQEQASVTSINHSMWHFYISSSLVSSPLLPIHHYGSDVCYTNSMFSCPHRSFQETTELRQAVCSYTNSMSLVPSPLLSIDYRVTESGVCLHEHDVLSRPHRSFRSR